MTHLGRGAMLLVAALALVAAGCGSDNAGGTTATASGSATTDVSATDASASDADVAAGLAQMVADAADTLAKTATDAEAGKAAAQGLETSWKPIEDVVKANEPDTYVDIEDAMALLESGDATRAAEGGAKIGTAVASYMAKHPG